MTCAFPDGDPKDWCGAHARDEAMLRALREEGYWDPGPVTHASPAPPGRQRRPRVPARRRLVS